MLEEDEFSIGDDDDGLLDNVDCCELSRSLIHSTELS